MTETNNPSGEAKEPRKVSLAEAIKNKLAQKQEAQRQENANRAKGLDKAGNQTMKSQMTKKVNNQRRRTGGN